MNNLYVGRRGSDVWYKIVEIRKHEEDFRTIVIDALGESSELQDNKTLIIDIGHQNLYAYLEFGELGTYFVGKYR